MTTTTTTLATPILRTDALTVIRKLGVTVKPCECGVENCRTLHLLTGPNHFIVSEGERDARGVQPLSTILLIHGHEVGRGTLPGGWEQLCTLLLEQWVADGCPTVS